MSPTPSIETVQGCLGRAVLMERSAARLQNDGDDWFAVCFFYAAYHYVRAALLSDPLFTSLGALAKVKQVDRLDLIMDDKNTKRHSGRVAGGQRSVGVNDLVRVLYPAIAVDYLDLHLASVDVRYNSGLDASTFGDILPSFTVVKDAYTARSLVAAPR